MIQETLINQQWGIQETKAADPDTGEEKVTQRTLIFIDPESNKQTVIPMPVHVAEDMGGQLQGQPPKKHLEVIGNGSIPEQVLRKGGHLGPGGIPRG